MKENRPYQRMNLEERAQEKLNKISQNKHYNKLHYLKLVGKTAQRIKEKDTKQLSLQDYKDIGNEVYKIPTNGIKARSIKRMMEQPPAKQLINAQLIKLYDESGLSLEDAKKLLEIAKSAAIEKKDVTNLIKLAEKIERAHNLVDNNRVNVSQTQIIDYSKVDEAGNPAVKEVKKIETSTSNNVIDTNLNNNVGNSSEKEDSDNT